MSGIAGIICSDGAPIEPGQITAMTGAMAHRGPDGINHWVKGPVAFGHCMLRTTPESLKETQPLTNEDECLVLVMDGRLDNRDELKQALHGQGIALRTLTDAEFVLRAYQLWGEDSPRHLLGDFAFTIWDARLERIFCARDHFGVKPFYYVVGNNFLAFASDEEAFLGLPAVSNELNEDRIACFLVPEFVAFDSHVSWLKNIVKLPPGKTLSVIRTGQRTSRTYWQLEPLQESQFTSDNECEEAFISVFEEAVRCRMRAAGHPGLMLSGGIDSAAIAGIGRCILRETRDLELHTFSVVSEEADTCSETHNIRSIVKGHEHYAHLIPVPSFRGIISKDDLIKAAWDQAHPVANSILLPAMVYLAASRNGHCVMYDGHDGDLVTYTPVRYISRILRSRAWREAWSEACQASVNNTYLRDLSPLTILSQSAWDIFVPSGVKLLKRNIGNLFHQDVIERSLINPDFARKICLAERLREWRAARMSENQQGEQEEHISVLTPIGLAGGSGGFGSVAARYGVEPRHPWSDKRVVEFYLRLPLRQKARGGWTKYLVRKAMASSLDKDVRWHTGKGNLGWRFVQGLMIQSGEEIQSTLRTAEDTIGTYIDIGKLRALLGNHRHANENSDDGYAGHLQLYTAMTLALWSRRIGAAN